MKSIFEEMGGTYRWEGDYRIPNIELPEQEEYQLGKYGRLHRRFLKEHHPARYSHLILEGQLWNHLVEIDKLFAIMSSDEFKNGQKITLSNYREGVFLLCVIL